MPGMMQKYSVLFLNVNVSISKTLFSTNLIVSNLVSARRAESDREWYRSVPSPGVAVRTGELWRVTKERPVTWGEERDGEWLRVTKERPANWDDGTRRRQVASDQGHPVARSGNAWLRAVASGGE